MKLLIAIIALVAGTLAAVPPNEFFAMDTIARGKPDQVVPLLKELGYQGLGGQAGDAVMAASLKEEGLRFYNGYLTLSFDDEKPALDDYLRGVLDRMNSFSAAVWLAIQTVQKDGVAFAKSSPEGDAVAVTKLREIVDYAARRRVPVALYPHTGMWMERVEDALRVAENLARQDVGVTFNLCHWLKVEGSERDPLPVIKTALPWLMFLTINGADTGDTRNMGWDRLIQPLGSGTYDVAGFMEKVIAAGYTGPVGFQGYGIKKEPLEVLKTTMAAWRAINAAPAREISAWRRPDASAKTLKLLSSIRPGQKDKASQTQMTDGQYVLWGELFEKGRMVAVVELPTADSEAADVAVADWKTDHWELQSAFVTRLLWQSKPTPKDEEFLYPKLPTRPFWTQQLRRDLSPLLLVSTAFCRYRGAHWVFTYDEIKHRVRSTPEFSVEEPSMRGGYVVLTNDSGRKAWWGEEYFYDFTRSGLAFRGGIREGSYDGETSLLHVMLPGKDGQETRWRFVAQRGYDDPHRDIFLGDEDAAAPEKIGAIDYVMRGETGMSYAAYVFSNLTGLPAGLIRDGSGYQQASDLNRHLAPPRSVKVTGSKEAIRRLSLKKTK